MGTVQVERPVWAPQTLGDSEELFEDFPYGLVLVALDGGRVINLNRRARQLLLSHSRGSAGPEWSCCELVCHRVGGMLEGRCLSELAAANGDLLPEIRMDVTTGHSRTAAWVTASRVDSDGARLLIHLRPASPGDRRRRSLTPSANGHTNGHAAAAPALRIATLGRFRVQGKNGPIGGDWLEQRPGELLKYLVSERSRAVTNERIAEALWPEAGPSEAHGRVRYYVHVLRERLEPQRPKRSPSNFINAGRGGYRLNIKSVSIDADEFEHEVRAGLAAQIQQGPTAAAPHLIDAMQLYRDDFLPEDPYAEWALNERERLRNLAVEALRALLEDALAENELDGAAVYARRLADMEPFDSEVQRTVLDICLRRGRRSEAVRRYAVLRQRMLRSFGEEPDFELAEVGR